MSSPQGQVPPEGGNDYSTLEVDNSRLTEAIPQQHGYSDYPEVRPETHIYPEVTPDVNNYPEVVPSEYHGYQEVEKDDAHEPSAVPVAAAAAVPRICGVKKRTFWILVAAAAIIVVAVIVGAVAGTLIPDSKSDDGAESDNSTSGNVSAIALNPNTKLASANFTDGLGNSNYIVAYQLANRAIYISIFNSSHGEWVVSPVVDGSTDVSLDDVMDGTGLGIDVYRHSNNVSINHLPLLSHPYLISSLFLSC